MDFADEVTPTFCNHLVGFNVVEGQPVIRENRSLMIDLPNVFNANNAL